VYKQKRSTTDKKSALLVTKKPSGIVSLKDLVRKTKEKIRLPSSTSHPNGSVLRDSKQKLSTLSSSKDLEGKETKSEKDRRLDGAKQRSAKQRLPSFVSHPNGIVLCVLKRQRSIIQTDQRRNCAK